MFEHFAYQNTLVFKGKELRNSGRNTNCEDDCSLTWQSLIDSDYVRLFHFIAANVEKKIADLICSTRFSQSFFALTL